MANAARIRGTVNMQNGVFGDWYHFTLHAVDGTVVAPTAFRTSDSKPRPVGSGEHEVTLVCEGREDNVSYSASVTMNVTFLPGMTYAVNGKIAVDKVIFWIERDGSGEKITQGVISTRDQDRPMGTVYVPIIVPK
jgi:hypothetical protein